MESRTPIVNRDKATTPISEVKAIQLSPLRPDVLVGLELFPFVFWFCLEGGEGGTSTGVVDIFSRHTECTASSTWIDWEPFSLFSLSF